MAILAPVLTSCDQEPADTAIEYTIDVIVGEGGSVAVEVEGVAVSKAIKGEEVTITATANEGKELYRWEVVSGDVELSGNPAVFTMPAGDVEIRVEFIDETIEMYTVTVTDDGNGTATANLETAPEGAEVIIVAKPNVGYDFGKWTVVSDNVSLDDPTDNNPKFIMPAGDVELRAEFVARPFNGYDYIPDEIFREKVWRVDTNQDGVLSKEEVEAEVSLFIGTIAHKPGGKIVSMAGIEIFTNLELLECYNHDIEELDLSKNTKLKTVDCYGNRISKLDVSGCSDLVELLCGVNSLTSLDLSNNLELTGLYCHSNQISSLDLSNNIKLSGVNATVNNLSSLDVSNNPELTFLACAVNNLTSLDVSDNPALQTLWCWDNQITSLDLSGNPALIDLECYYNKLSSVDVSSNPALSVLLIGGPEVTSVDVSNNPMLYSLNVSQTSITSLNLSNNPALEVLVCAECNLLTSLDVSNNPELIEINFDKGAFSAAVDISKNSKLEYLLCNSNNLTSLDLSNSPSLQHIKCNNNRLTSLNISDCPDLDYLECADNDITSLDVSNNPSLFAMNCSDNDLTSLGGFDKTAIELMWCKNNNLSVGTLRTIIAELPSMAENWGGYGEMDCTGNPGGPLLTAADIKVATDKDWMVWCEATNETATQTAAAVFTKQQPASAYPMTQGPARQPSENDHRF